MTNIVLVWAWGTGMYGIAGILHELWFKNIICIDSTQSQLTDNLEKKWLKVIIGHRKYTPTIDDIIIYSEAVAQSPEILKARSLITEHKKIIFIMNYFQFLGEISKYFTTIGITGTNGKSSATALTLYGAKDFSNFGLGILGALTPDFNNESYLINQSNKDEIKSIFTKILTGKTSTPIDHKKLLFIVEACEYKRHFLNLDLDYAAITSLEFDHADYYKDFDDYKNAFKEMLTKLKKKCFVLKWFLEENPDFKEYKNSEEIEEKEYTFDYIFWPHVNKNTTLVNKLLQTQNSDFKVENIQQFKGLRRRLEYLWTTEKWAQIYSDYGHMASSLAIGYQALRRKFPDKKLIAIFQPHQITRIFTWRDDFVKSFTGYDDIIIYDIYAARENIQDFDFSRRGENIHNIQELGNTFAQQCWGKYISSREELKWNIETNNWGTILAVFSAGDIDYKLRTDITLKH